MRLLRLPGRTKLLIAVGVLLAVILATGSCQGVDITEAEATAAARTALAVHPDGFEPARVEARVLRQGFPPSPVWVVVLTVPDPEGSSEDFLHHAGIWVDAKTGQIRQVDISQSDDG
ncbi:MAG: hypothetical protein OXC06_08385 [Acidimicrobiaceae bacterium]|nr:hypothetical protein [Acidimicrobiaceae bacterium]